MKRYKQNSSAFTLVELLVVIGIIAVLLAITVPATSIARGLAKQITCRSNLRSIGWAFLMYMDDNRLILPPACNMPSAPLNTKPPITNFLNTYLKDQRIYKCPADQGIKYQDQGKSYFEIEGSSYWYEDSLGGLPISASPPAKNGQNEVNIQVMYDYEPFHGPPGKVGSKSYLYADGHVGSFKNQ